MQCLFHQRAYEATMTPKRQDPKSDALGEYSSTAAFERSSAVANCWHRCNIGENSFDHSGKERLLVREALIECTDRAICHVAISPIDVASKAPWFKACGPLPTGDPA